MRYVASRILIGISAALITLVLPVNNLADQERNLADAAAGHRYPDFGFLPAESQYEGRVFKLSQSYPQNLPDPREAPVFCTSDFNDVKKNWMDFLMQVRAYCLKDTIFGGDVEDDWRVENQPKNHWYHMPWQHYGPNGREGIHGLTKEAPVQIRQLAWTQTYAGGQTYAVALYNEFGGYTIGKVWHDHEHPGQDPSNLREQLKIEFPVGTVVCKVLFVDVPPMQVPFLNPPLIWQGYITENYQSSKRAIRDLALIQMDIMVRHQNAPCGWVFGTYQYNGQRRGADQKNLWNNLVPVGLQWGNDPSIKDDRSNPQPVATMINERLEETAINADREELPATHLGWNGRLNGPVDNAMSSCMSCHMTAETPQRSQISPLFETTPPPPGSEQWMRWFQNRKCGEAFDRRALPTDFSLQMAIGLQNFRSWRNEGSKMRAERYSPTKVRARIKATEQPPGPHMKTMHDATDTEEVDIRRDYPRGQGP